jgi:hypothetical protein
MKKQWFKGARVVPYNSNFVTCLGDEMSSGWENTNEALVQEPTPM